MARRGAPVGSLVAWWREVRGWSRGRLARELGVVASTITHYEKGRNEPSIDRLEKIARLTGAGSLAGFLSARVPRNYKPRPRVARAERR